MRERARASRAAANKRKKPRGIGRAARCRELPGLTRFRSPLNNALLPVMFRAAHIFATSGRASVRAGLAIDQSELFCTDGGKRPAQSHKCRAPSRAPKPLGVRAFEGLGCAPPRPRPFSYNSRPRLTRSTRLRPVCSIDLCDAFPASSRARACAAWSSRGACSIVSGAQN
jgi:hypothetical protein